LPASPPSRRHFFNQILSFLIRHFLDFDFIFVFYWRASSTHISSVSRHCFITCFSVTLASLLSRLLSPPQHAHAHTHAERKCVLLLWLLFDAWRTCITSSHIHITSTYTHITSSCSTHLASHHHTYTSHQHTHIHTHHIICSTHGALAPSLSAQKP